MSQSNTWFTLDDDEEIVWSGHPDLRAAFWRPAVPLVTMLVLPISILEIGTPFLILSVLGPAVVLIGVLLFAGIGLISYIRIKNTAYVVSTKYAYAKRGTLGRSVTQVGLQNIQDTTLSKGIFGTWSGYGKLSFSIAGGSDLAFQRVTDPSTVKSIVDQQVNAVHTETRRSQQQTNHASESGDVDVLLAELRATRKAAQRIEQRIERRADS